jgi:hypothetical protein
MSYEILASNTFDKPVSMLPYHDYTTNEPTVQHQIIDMPDQYEYSDPAVGRRNARNQAGQPQLSSQPVFYPLIEQNWHTTHDIYHGFSGFIHHPTAEDFLRADHPLPAPPNEVYDSDQNLPIIEPDSCLNGGLLDIRDTHDTNADFRTAVPAASIRRSSDHGGTFNRIQTMSSDTYHTALGGLRKISSGLHRKSSKRDRVKRFLKDMNPFRHRRDYGERASRTRDSIN